MAMKKTILLIHGAWMTPACWASFRSLYEARGYECLTPPWPFLDRPIGELRRAPHPELASVTIKNLVDHFHRIIRSLPEPPIVMGHSFGGLIAQMLADRGLGLAAVAIDPGPPRWVLPSPTAIRSALPVLSSWNGWNRVLTMSFASFAGTFANTLPPSDQRDAYETQVVPAPGRIYFQAAFGIGNGVRFGNSGRPPMLLLSGRADKTSTTSMARSMLKKHRRSPIPVDLIEFEGRSHWLIAEPGWEEVAQRALDWCELQIKRS